MIFQVMKTAAIAVWTDYSGPLPAIPTLLLNRGYSSTHSSRLGLEGRSLGLSLTYFRELILQLMYPCWKKKREDDQSA